jgi:xanthine dehydrogenase accessory factor
VDLFFSPQPEPAVIADTLSRLEAREPAALSVTEGGVRMVHVVGDGGWQGEGFEVVYLPPLRIVAIGQGEDLTAFVRLAHRFGADVTALSPSQIDVDLLSGEGIETFELVSRTGLPSIRSDAWTAIVLLFHDHDWEETLLPHALNLPAFYFGAVGSRRTHQARLEMLRLAGVPERLQAALRGPVGLIPATRDPATLALSILAEVVSEYQRMIAPTKGPALAAS